MVQTEYVQIIDRNTVIAKENPRRVILEQLVFYKRIGSRIECVGYLVKNQSSSHSIQQLGQKWECHIIARDGTQRRIVADNVVSSEDCKDKEVKDRENGERRALFGLGPWGDVAG